jgi:hypothetical protein
VATGLSVRLMPPRGTSNRNERAEEKAMSAIRTDPINPSPRDFLGSWRQTVLAYGLPIAAIMATGNPYIGANGRVDGGLPGDGRRLPSECRALWPHTLLLHRAILSRNGRRNGSFRRRRGAARIQRLERDREHAPGGRCPFNLWPRTHIRQISCAENLEPPMMRDGIRRSHPCRGQANADRDLGAMSPTCGSSSRRIAGRCRTASDAPPSRA